MFAFFCILCGVGAAATFGGISYGVATGVEAIVDAVSEEQKMLLGIAIVTGILITTPGWVPWVVDAVRGE